MSEREITFGGEQDVREEGEGATSVDEMSLQKAIAEGLNLEDAGVGQTGNPEVDRYLTVMDDKDAFAVSTSELAVPQGRNDNNTMPDTGESSEQPDEPITNEDGREFKSREEYLQWKIGDDGRRWGEERSALNERIAKLEGMVETGLKQSQPSQNVAEQKAALKAQLFQNASKEEIESGFVSMDTLVDAFVQNGTLLGQNLQQYLQPFVEKVQGVESRVSEVAARSKYNIDQQKEKAILQKHPYLKNLPFDERMAVLADLAPKPDDAGRKPLVPVRQQVPKPTAQEYVEGSVPSQGATSGLDELYDEFDKLPARQQLNLLTGIVRDSPDAQAAFKPPDSF